MAQTTYEAVSNGRNGNTVTRGNDTTFTAAANGVAIIINTDNTRLKGEVLKQLRDAMAILSADMNSATDASDLPTSGSVGT